jgi:hypothetical protein
MTKSTILYLLIFVTICISLNAEDPFLIRENTNFNYNNNSIALENGVVSVWSDTKTSVWNLYAQKVDAGGNKLWNNGQPLLIDENQGCYPAYTRVVKTNDNCIIITWIQFFNPDDYRLYAQKVSSSGQLLWSQNNELILEADFYPRIYLIANESDGAYIIYDNYETDEVQGINLDSNANDLWSGFTDPLLGDVRLRDIKSDNNGGVVISYNEYTGDENLMAARIDFDREILWNEIVTITLPSYYYPEIVAVGSSDFIIWWRWEDNVIGQRIDLNGNLYWGAEGMVINNEAIYTNSRTLLSGCNNSFFMAYIIETSPPSNDQIFKISKYDLDGNALWSNAIVLSNSYCYNVVLCTDANQNCVITWYNYDSIFAQKVDSNGNKLWGDEGIIIDSEFEFEWTQGGLQLNELNEQILCTWQPIQAGKSYSKYQAMDTNGNLQLPEDGVEIQSGNYSYIDQYQLIGNDESSYSLWEDYRFGQKRIFVQRLAPNGANYFPTDGIAITDTAFHHQENFRTKALPEGGVIVVWNEVKENETLERVRWQIINPNGTANNLNGNDITIDVVNDQTNPQIDIVDGNIVVMWLENENIKAQKLVNYSPVWGSNGSPLIENGNTGYFTLTGSYIKFEYLDENYFQRIEENGSLAADWPYPGVACISVGIKTLNEYNGDLVITWLDNDAGIKDYGFQILNSSGEYIHPDNGFTIFENVTFYDHDFLFDGCINLFHEEEAGTNIIMERYDLQGNLIWNEVTIQNNDYFNRLKATKLGENFLVTWYTNFDETTSSYIMRMIDSNGNTIPSNLANDDFLLISERRDYQLATITDTDASILFKRGYDIGSETTFFFSGLVSYQVNVSDVPISEDEIVNTVKIQLSNHPNPFNPTTKIRFQISDSNEIESAEIAIYNLKGQKTKTIPVILSEVEGRGNEFSVIWNGTDDNEKQVSSGVYFYKLNVNGETKASRKCLLLK